METRPPRDPWLPQVATGSPSPVHWYSPARFEQRVLAELRRDPKITVAQFIARFAALTDRSKRARIAEAAGLQYQPLSALLERVAIVRDIRGSRP